ncbi:hypothetical protein D3C79_942230 [compost metagenome]
MLAGLERRNALGHVRHARVAGHFAEHAERYVGLGQVSLEQRQWFQGQHARVGDQQGTAHAQQGAALCQCLERTRSAENIRGVIPIVKGHQKLQIGKAQGRRLARQDKGVIERAGAG